MLNESSSASLPKLLPTPSAPSGGQNMLHGEVEIQPSVIPRVCEQKSYGWPENTMCEVCPYCYVLDIEFMN